MKKYIKSATSNARYTIKSISDEGTYFLVKDWRKNKELWVSKEKMDRHPEWWFTSSGKAKQSLKSLLSVMDEYLTDTFTVIDDSGNETPLDVKDLGFDHIPEYWDDDIDACDEVTAGYDYRYSAGRIEDDGTEDFYYDTGFDSYDEACDWGSNHDCTHIFDRKSNKYIPIGFCDEVTASNKTRYMANMVSASDDSYEQLAVGDDTDSEDYIEYGKYYVAGYLQSSYRGLMEDLYSDDFEEILVNAADMAGQGLYVEITNRADGRSERYTPEDFEEAASNGDYPDHIREDLAL